MTTSLPDTHTPGPWRAEMYHGRWVPEIFAGDKKIATVAYDTANAHLIAAAPDLLAATQELADAIEKQLAMTGKGITPSPRLQAALDAARAAIAKAKGGVA